MKPTMLLPGVYKSLPLLLEIETPDLPDQEYWLLAHGTPEVEAFKKSIGGNHLFGSVLRQPLTSGKYGLVCCIKEQAIRESAFFVLAVSTQRFKVIDMRLVPKGYYEGDVEILTDTVLPSPLTIHRMNSLNGLRSLTTQKSKALRHEAASSPWPSWVFKMYDGDNLRQRVEKELPELVRGLPKECQRKMPNDLTGLSFWVAAHMDPKKSDKVLEMNSAITRIRWCLSQMAQTHHILCKLCGTTLGHQKDFFDVLGAHLIPQLNKGVTLTRVENVRDDFYTFSEHWLRRYQQRFVMCQTCRHRIGRKFTALAADANPPIFWFLHTKEIEIKPQQV